MAVLQEDPVAAARGRLNERRSVIALALAKRHDLHQHALLWVVSSRVLALTCSRSE